MALIRSLRVPALLLSVSSSIAPVAAHAQQTSSTAQAPVNANLEADALVQQGVAHRRAGQDQLALESFRRAFALQPSPRTRAQIALAEQALGQWADADRDLRAALAANTDDWIQRNRAALEAALNAIASRVATIELTCNTTGARLFVNGHEESAFPLAQPLRVEAGTVAIEIRMDGYRTARRAIDVEGGRTYRESFTLVPIPVEDDPQDALQPDRRGNQRVAPPLVVQPEPPAPPLSWALIGAGGAMLAVGAIGHGYWQNRVALYNSNVQLNPDGTFEPGCFYSTPEYPRRADRCAAILSESWAGFGLALSGYVLGAAGISAGLIVRFTSRPAPAERPQSAHTNNATSAAQRSRATLASAWTCAPTLGLSGAQCIVRF